MLFSNFATEPVYYTVNDEKVIGVMKVIELSCYWVLVQKTKKLENDFLAPETYFFVALNM